MKTIHPLPSGNDSFEPTEHEGATEAIGMLRAKINGLYTTEPDAKKELAEATIHTRPKSKHQQFMLQLSTSGKSLADIQTAWHNYYQGLPNHEKKEVWQEFYADYNKTQTLTSRSASQAHQQPTTDPNATTHYNTVSANRQLTDTRSSANVQDDIRRKVASKRSKPSHLKSIGFGLGMGIVMLAFMMFGFFNERIVAPFISPSNQVSVTPIIASAQASVGPEPKIIIPKINVEIPIVFDQPSIAEDDVQASLEEGVLHYATTSKPGEAGNGAIFGHSSNNILNPGKYKFAFVLLQKLDEGDTFMINYESQQYVYRVYKKTVVTPTEVSVLNKQEKPSTMSLITCDPPGTTLNRLVVVGEQISPNPSSNVASSATPVEEANVSVLPSNAPSLWSRLTSWL